MNNQNLLIMRSTDCHTPYIETLMKLFSETQLWTE